MWVSFQKFKKTYLNTLLNQQPFSFRGLDNKVTVYPLSLEEDVTIKKKTVGTHMSYTSCCTFPNSDQQVSMIKFFL